MAKKEIVINGIVFSSIKQIESHVRSLLLRHEALRGVYKGSPDFTFLQDLIKRHPQYIFKKGVGINCFLIRRSFRNNIELYILRTDSTEVDISWKTCASGRGSTAEQNLREAMRVSIDYQIEDFRRHTFQDGMNCSICISSIVGVKNSHVDHEIPFEKLVEDFLHLNSGLSVPTTFDDEAVTNRAKFKEDDLGFETTWELYHKNNARLRIVHSKCNLTRSKKA